MTCQLCLQEPTDDPTLPCDVCRGWMRVGCIFISVKDGSTSNTSPVRTGGWAVLRSENVEKMRDAGVEPSFVDRILKQRAVFVEDRVWDGIGLPRAKLLPGHSQHRSD